MLWRNRAGNNYDIPDTPEAYTHRIGRTGRAAKTGDAFTLVTHEDDIMVRSIERVFGGKIERRLIEGFDYSVPAPKKDAEFVRPPREPQRRKETPGAKPAGRHAVGAGAKSTPRPANHAARRSGR